MGSSLTPRLQRCVRAFEDELDFVCRTLRRHGVPPADVPDLAQEVFIVMWRRWSEFDQSRSLRPWLAGIAWRVASGHRRRQPPEVPFAGAELERVDPGPHGEEGLAAARARRLVLQALDALPAPYRTVLILHDIDGVPMREIAASQRVPLFTAYTRLRRARHSFAAAVRLQSQDRERHHALLLVPGLGARVFWPVGLTAIAAAAVLLWFSLPPSPAHGEARARAASGQAAPPAAIAAARGRVSGPRPWRAAHLFEPRPPRLLAPPTAGAQRPADPLTRGLVAHWSFDDAAGATARDSSGHGPDCALRTTDGGQAWTPGRLGAAVELAAQRWLECPMPPMADGSAGELTVSVWVTGRTRPRGNSAIVARQLGKDARDHVFLGYINGRLTLSSHSWGVYLRHRAPLDGRWHHLAATRAPDTVTLYVDGQAVGRKTIRAPRREPVDTPLLIGGGSNRPGVVRELIDGAVDDVRLYDRALDEAEVAALAAGATTATAHARR
jgi:RNA polymerase sigma-70 factor (ECF subfamily)